MPKSISTTFTKYFGSKNGIDLDYFINSNRQPHEAISFDIKIPNNELRDSIEKSRKGIDVIESKCAESLFNELAI